MVLTRVGQPQFTRAGDITRTRDKNRGRIKHKIGQLGRIFLGPNVERTRGSSNTHPDQPMAGSCVNDNQCVSFLPLRLLAESSPQETMNTLSVVKFNVVHPVPSAPGHSQKNEISPGAAECQSKQSKLKFVKGVSCVIPLSCAQPVINAPNVATNLPVGARLQNFSKIWSDLGASPKAVQILKEGYTLPFRTRPNLSRNPTVISCYGNPHRNLSLLEALHQLMDKNAIELVHKLPRVFQPAIFSPKTQQQVEAYSGLKQSEPLPQGGKIQDGDTGNYQGIPPKRGVGHLNRLQGCLLPHSHTGTVQEISEVSCKRADLSIQSSAFRTVHSTLRVHCDCKGGKADGHTQGYKNPPVPRQLVGEGNIPPGLSPAYTSPSRNVPETGMASECRKVGIGAQAGFQLCRLPVRPSVRSGLTDTGLVAKPSRQNTGASNSTGLSCH